MSLPLLFCVAHWPGSDFHWLLRRLWFLKLGFLFLKRVFLKSKTKACSFFKYKATSKDYYKDREFTHVKHLVEFLACTDTQILVFFRVLSNWLPLYLTASLKITIQCPDSVPLSLPPTLYFYPISLCLKNWSAQM